MLLRNKSNHETSVTGIAGNYVKLLPGEQTQVADDVGNGYLRNYGTTFERVESQGGADGKLIEANKILAEENLLLKRKVKEQSDEIIKLNNQITSKTKGHVQDTIKTPSIDVELEELTKQWKEITGRDTVPNNKKNNKQWLKDQIDKQRLLSAK